MAKLVRYNIRNGNAAEKRRHNRYAVDQYEIVQRPGVRDDAHTRLNAQLIQNPALSRQVRDVERLVDLVRL